MAEPPLPLYRLIYDPTTKAVLFLEPATGQHFCLGTTFQGSEAACQAKITALGLTPLPDPALAAAKTAKLATLATALNAALTTLFGTAPIQAQVTFSNITTPIAKLITAGELAQAEAALQGMLTDQLVPPGYSAFIDPAIAEIVAAIPKWTAVNAATTVVAVAAV